MAENWAGSPVAYWKVRDKRGRECFFRHRVNADAFTIASGCSYLYEVLPVWEDQCKEMPAESEFMD